MEGKEKKKNEKIHQPRNTSYMIQWLYTALKDIITSMWFCTEHGTKRWEDSLKISISTLVIQELFMQNIEGLHKYLKICKLQWKSTYWVSRTECLKSDFKKDTENLTRLPGQHFFRNNPQKLGATRWAPALDK